MENNELNIEFYKWIPLEKSKTDDELKKLVLDFDKGLIFTDKHLEEYDNISMVFMVLFLMGTTKKTGGTRKDKIYNLLQDDAREKYFKSIGKTEPEAKEDYFKSIGMIYEYLDKQSGMCVNGKPTFYSCVFLSVDDCKRFFELYDEYMELKKTLMENFGV